MINISRASKENMFRHYGVQDINGLRHFHAYRDMLYNIQGRLTTVSARSSPNLVSFSSILLCSVEVCRSIFPGKKSGVLPKRVRWCRRNVSFRRAFPDLKNDSLVIAICVYVRHNPGRQRVADECQVNFRAASISSKYILVAIIY